jgi:RHS repeat-associated protein
MAATRKYDDRQRAESNGVDAVHRLLSLMSPNAVRSSMIRVTYPGSGNYSQFAYDGFGRNVLIQEYTSSSLTSTRRFVWCDDLRCESRDISSSITAQYVVGGEISSGTSYYVCGSHDRSDREMTNSSGTVVAEYAYDPFGRVSKLAGSVDADFQYTGYFVHARSGLSLAESRVYDATIGRFINRDPILENGGVNLYEYASNAPTEFIDPSGLAPKKTCPARPPKDPCSVLGPHGNGRVWIIHCGQPLLVNCTSGKTSGYAGYAGQPGVPPFTGYNPPWGQPLLQGSGINSTTFGSSTQGTHQIGVSGGDTNHGGVNNLQYPIGPQAIPNTICQPGGWPTIIETKVSGTVTTTNTSGTVTNTNTNGRVVP